MHIKCLAQFLAYSKCLGTIIRYCDDDEHVVGSKYTIQWRESEGFFFVVVSTKHYLFDSPVLFLSSESSNFYCKIRDKYLGNQITLFSGCLRRYLLSCPNNFFVIFFHLSFVHTIMRFLFDRMLRIAMFTCKNDFWSLNAINVQWDHVLRESNNCFGLYIAQNTWIRNLEENKEGRKKIF